MSKTHPRQRGDVRRDLGGRHLRVLHPPLPCEGHHSDETLCVDRRCARVVPRPLELGGEHVAHPEADLGEQVRQTALRRGVAGQHGEPVRAFLDVPHERECGALDALAWRTGGDRSGDLLDHVVHLAVDDDGVQALLATEVLIDDRFRDLGLLGDLLDRRALVALLGEHPSAHLDQLVAAIACREPGPCAICHVEQLTTAP